MNLRHNWKQKLQEIKGSSIVLIFFNKVERDKAYADSLCELYRQFPDDDEIAAFYSLALLGKTQGERNLENYMQAAGVLEEIYQDNPEHLYRPDTWYTMYLVCTGCVLGLLVLTTSGSGASVTLLIEVAAIANPKPVAPFAAFFKKSRLYLETILASFNFHSF